MARTPSPRNQRIISKGVTGKTEQGTFSSQLIRNCFRTAARMYLNYAE